MFDNPETCDRILKLSTQYYYQGYFTIQYMNGDDILDSFIYTTNNKQYLCNYQPTFTMVE